jgi:hypothetical protein
MIIDKTGEPSVSPFSLFQPPLNWYRVQIQVPTNRTITHYNCTENSIYLVCVVSDSSTLDIGYCMRRRRRRRVGRRARHGDAKAAGRALFAVNYPGGVGVRADLVSSEL